MKEVRFTKTGEPAFVALGPVSGGVDVIGPQGLRVNGGPVIKAQDFTRASEVKLFNRGNSSWTATFSVWRKHEDLEAAQDFLMLHPGELPTAADMLCSITLNDGAIRYLTTPFIRLIDSDMRLGETTNCSYRLMGGKLTTTNPNA